MRKRGKNREKRDGRKGGGVSASLPTLETEATQMEKKRERKNKTNREEKRERERQRDIVGIAILFFKGGKKEN